MFEWIFDTLGLLGNVAVFLLGMLVLNKSSNIAVDSSVKIAEITGLGKMAVGFLLIAIFTTLPELSVSIFSVINPEIVGVAIGNVLGANIVNVCLILGLCFLILTFKNRGKAYHFSKKINENVRDLHFGLLIVSLIPLALIHVGYASSAIGITLVAIFVANSIRMIKSKKNITANKQNSDSDDENSITKYVLLSLLGVAGVVASAYFMVETASWIAENVGIPKVVIGATVMAFGTSLPELATGINATIKGHTELVLGNIVGGGFMRTTLVLGVALLGVPFRVDMTAFLHVATFSVMANLFLLYFLSGEEISWREGAILFFMYILFITTIFGAS